ncbi:MAG TPA: FKBP-type peptidyl-prolyl cis-trans isomerase [Gammaproteobacteria bacterium]|nr:FKBP-type peptidyl-prolyl cis-trans isomerase [Gammaproteobacteria bacterium]
MHSATRVLAALVLCCPVAGLPQETTVDEAAQAVLPEEVEELVITDTKTGAGAAVAPGQTAVVHYTGWLYDPAAPEGKGRKFDSSRDRGTPFRFALGAGQVIRGWDEGVAGMQVGGERRLLIPPELGYGELGAGGVIPPGATLVFDVELMDVE